MYKTRHGSFTGDTWEEFCQTCFKIKYESDGYQEMPVWQGDLGIEGFTRNGILFQCYCPDEEYAADELYDKQRDKITRDLSKLIKNKKDLQKYLGGNKICKWIFVTPGYKKRDIVLHCQEKAKEYRDMKLDYFDESFDVLIYDIDFFAEEIPIAINYTGRKLEINPDFEQTSSEISDWSKQEIYLTENAIRKNGHRVKEGVHDRDGKINRLTQNIVSSFLNGNSIIKTLSERFPKDYEKFVRVVAIFEKQVEDRCIVNDGNCNQLYKEISIDLKVMLKESFPYFESLTTERLAEQVLADWILRCPIDFE